MDVTQRLINYVASVQYEDLPREVVMATKRTIMNTLAAIIGGSGAPGVKEIAGLVKGWGGKPESTVLLHGYKVPAHEAVLANASMPRAIEFDDFHFQTGIHPFSAVVPVALAAAESHGEVTGKEFITAVAIGAEVLCRMRLVPDSCIGVSGWSGEVYGAFGSAITAGKVLGINREEMGHALGLAYIQAAGNAQTLYEGALGYRLQQGFSARAGVLSAILASTGITGPKDFLNGKAGFYPVYYRGMSCDINRLIDGIGERYEVLNIVTKAYPCCGFLMAPIENAIDLMRENRLAEKDMARALVRVNQWMYNTVCSPLEAKYRPQTISDAIYNLPYVIGTALLRNDISLDDFSAEAIRDPERLRAVDKVEVLVDEGIERESEALHQSLSLHELELETESGDCFSRKISYAKGFPQNPMTIEDCAVKARKCARFAVKEFPDKKVEKLREIVKNLEEQRNALPLIELLS
jgi:2-methylcitrate dehydratase PrpD